MMMSMRHPRELFGGFIHPPPTIRGPSRGETQAKVVEIEIQCNLDHDFTKMAWGYIISFCL